MSFDLYRNTEKRQKLGLEFITKPIRWLNQQTYSSEPNYFLLIVMPVNEKLNLTFSIIFSEHYFIGILLPKPICNFNADIFCLGRYFGKEKMIG